MPARGATIQNNGNWSTSAPKLLRILLVFPFCNAKPNWIPINPMLIVNICPIESRAFRNNPVEAVGILEAVAIVAVSLVRSGKISDTVRQGTAYN